jgi:hypothetical protein
MPDLAYHCADPRCTSADPCPECTRRITERGNAFDRARDRADIRMLQRLAEAGLPKRDELD